MDIVGAFPLLIAPLEQRVNMFQMGSRPGTWIGALVVGILFSIFSFTMSCMTGWNLMINYTSVEGIQRGGIHNIAFLISQPSRRSSTTLPPGTPPSTSGKSHKKRSDRTTEGASSEEDWPVLATVTRASKRSYVVMQTKPFEHPWYTSLMQGWKDTMGHGILDWLLPFKQSPCKNRSHRGEFAWGEVVYDMARMYEEKHPEVRLALLHGSSRR